MARSSGPFGHKKRARSPTPSSTSESAFTPPPIKSAQTSRSSSKSATKKKRFKYPKSLSSESERDEESIHSERGEQTYLGRTKKPWDKKVKKGNKKEPSDGEETEEGGQGEKEEDANKRVAGDRPKAADSRATRPQRTVSIAKPSFEVIPSYQSTELADETVGKNGHPRRRKSKSNIEESDGNIGHYREGQEEAYMPGGFDMVPLMEEAVEEELEEKAEALTAALAKLFKSLCHKGVADLETGLTRLGKTLETALEPFAGQIIKEQYDVRLASDSNFFDKVKSQYSVFKSLVNSNSTKTRDLLMRSAELCEKRRDMIKQGEERMMRLLDRQAAEVAEITEEVKKSQIRCRKKLELITDRERYNKDLRTMIDMVLDKGQGA